MRGHDSYTTLDKLLTKVHDQFHNILDFKCVNTHFIVKERYCKNIPSFFYAENRACLVLV